MGLFFMGVIVLLEKSQRVNHALDVTPVTIDAYVASKIGVMAGIGGVVALCIASVSHLYLIGVGIGVVLASSLFSMIGLWCATQAKSLNHFVLLSVPFELFICLPAIIYLFGGLQSSWWQLHPGIATLTLISKSQEIAWLAVIVLIGWNGLFYAATHQAVSRSMKVLGGGKL